MLVTFTLQELDVKGKFFPKWYKHVDDTDSSEDEVVSESSYTEESDSEEDSDEADEEDQEALQEFAE